MRNRVREIGPLSQDRSAGKHGQPTRARSLPAESGASGPSLVYRIVIRSRSRRMEPERKSVREAEERQRRNGV